MGRPGGPQRQDQLTDWATYGVFLVALAMGVNYAWNQVHDRRSAAPFGGTRPDRTVANIAQVADSRTRLGPDSAGVILVEFGDYECLFCRRMEGAIEHLLHAYPDEVAVVFRHFPLSSHPNALHAAEMASCAETLGYFPEVHRFLFRVVTLEGLDPETLASDSGIPDPSEMRRCLDSGEGRARVEEDVRLGQDLEIQGVPSFILQGVLLGSAPDSARLVDLVRQKVDEQRASGSSPVAAIR